MRGRDPMGRVAAIGAMVIFLAGPAGRADAGGSRDLADVWLVSPQDVGGAPVPAWRLELGTGHLFGLCELPQYRLEGRLDHARWSAGAAWERLGSGPYREDSVRLQAGLGRGWRLGIEGGADRLLIGEEDSRVCPALAVRTTTGRSGSLRLDVWWHLAAAPPWYGAGGVRRLARLTGRGHDWAWAVAIDRAADGRPSVQADILARVAPGACLGLRADPWSGAVGLSTAWWVKVGWLRTSHLVHPDLGTTHRWALVLGARPEAGT